MEKTNIKNLKKAVEDGDPDASTKLAEAEATYKTNKEARNAKRKGDKQAKKKKKAAKAAKKAEKEAAKEAKKEETTELKVVAAPVDEEKKAEKTCVAEPAAKQEIKVVESPAEKTPWTERSLYMDSCEMNPAFTWNFETFNYLDSRHTISKQVLKWINILIYLSFD